MPAVSAQMYIETPIVIIGDDGDPLTFTINSYMYADVFERP